MNVFISQEILAADCFGLKVVSCKSAIPSLERHQPQCDQKLYDWSHAQPIAV